MPPAKILLAEDHASTRTVMAGILRNAGFDVDGVASGVDAVLLLKKTTYDLLITDLIMPEGTGFEVIQHLRARKVHIPVLICSGYMAGKGIEGKLEGFRFSTLPKPFRHEALLAAVRGLLPQADPKK